MSPYEAYDKISQNYDETRVPVGIEILLGCLAKSDKPIHQTTLLDAGCGTGSYSQELVNHVKRIEAVDTSDGMIRMASRKLKRHRNEGRISFSRARLDALPFETGFVDAVMVNQVLHHIDDPGNNHFPGQRRIIQEFYRVLRPSGSLVINTCSQEQLRYGYWYCDLVPEAVKMLSRRFIPLDNLRELLIESGFTYHGSFVPLDGILQGEDYFDVCGPLNENWRAGDSTFALATEEQLGEAYKTINKLDANGKLTDHFEKLDRHRKFIGQVTFILATRNE
jgi:ubiquinone/menaquinone biosynthesis C-methylase UbiE